MMGLERSVGYKGRVNSFTPLSRLLQPRNFGESCHRITYSLVIWKLEDGPRPFLAPHSPMVFGNTTSSSAQHTLPDHTILLKISFDR